VVPLCVRRAFACLLFARAFVLTLTLRAQKVRESAVRVAVSVAVSVAARVAVSVAVSVAVFVAVSVAGTKSLSNCVWHTLHHTCECTMKSAWDTVREINASDSEHVAESLPLTVSDTLFITHMNAPWECVIHSERHSISAWMSNLTHVNESCHKYQVCQTQWERRSTPATVSVLLNRSLPLCLTHCLSRIWMHHATFITHVHAPWDCKRHVYIYICRYRTILSHCVWHTLYPAYECITRHLSHICMHHETVKDTCTYIYIYIYIYLFSPTVSDTLSILRMNASCNIYHTYECTMRL